MPKRKKFKFLERDLKRKKMEDNAQLESDSECDVLDMIDDEELENIKSSYGNSVAYRTSSNKNREIVSSSSEEEEEEDDVQHRKNVISRRKKKYEALQQNENNMEKDKESVNKRSYETGEIEGTNLERSLSLAEKLAERKKAKIELRIKIGQLASDIVESPESSMSSLKALTLLLKNRDLSANMVNSKLTILSLLEIYKDIIPTYRIRSLSEKEKAQKMKKDTKKLVSYEESLLRYYKQYLDFLEKLVQATIKLEKLKNHNMFTERKRNIGLLAIKCLNQLLATHPYFNYNSDIINILVPLMTHRNKKISETCCTTVSGIFKEDRIGETSLLIVKRIVKLIKERQGNVLPEVLRTLLNLSIKESDIKDNKEEDKDIKKIRANLAKMSRRERKYNKRMQMLKKELRTAEVEESKSQKAKIKSEILKHIFHIYFRVLKSPTRVPLLTPVLEGLSKFAHLINIEFFDDLISVLHKLIESSNLTNNEILHSLNTVFIVLSGQGSLLNIDPQGFFKPLYKILLDLHIGKADDDFITLLRCLDIMIVKRLKTNTLQRTLAFMKRLCTVGLQSSSNSTLALLSIVRTLMISCNRSDILLDIENSLGSGLYLPELEDPEHCNAHSTVLWELHLLSSHYHPVVRKYSYNILHSCPLQGKGDISAELAKLKAEELFYKYDPANLDMKT